jgi:hypothetical protein
MQKTMYNNAPDAIAPCCKLKWSVLVKLDTSRNFHVAFALFPATTALNSSYLSTDGMADRLWRAAGRRYHRARRKQRAVAGASCRKGGKYWTIDK